MSSPTNTELDQIKAYLSTTFTARDDSSCGCDSDTEKLIESAQAVTQKDLKTEALRANIKASEECVATLKFMQGAFIILSAIEVYAFYKRYL